MHPTYFEAAMAFLGFASIVLGAFADRLTEYVLGEATSAQHPRSHSPSSLHQSRMSSRT